MPKQTKTYIKILEAALPLFAAFGYKGVAMRDIANTVGITAAALYNHFPNKEQLYFKALEYAFAEKVADLAKNLSATDHDQEKLARLVEFWLEAFGSDVILRALLQREMADADKARLNLLVEHVFRPVYVETEALMCTLAKNLDGHLLFVSIIGLVMYHFEMGPIRQLLPGYAASHENHETIIQHVTHLLLNGLQ